MSTTGNLPATAAQPGAPGNGITHTDSLDLPAITTEIERDLREHGDLFEFQRRCEALVHAFANDAEDLRALQWLISQAELVDCMLVPGTRESIAEALHELSARLARSPQG